MKNLKIILIICFIILFQPINAEAICQPELCMVEIPTDIKPVKYTVPTAKAEAFRGIKQTLPLLSFKSDLEDRNRSTNIEYMKKNLLTSGDKSRLLSPNFIGQTLISYGVRYTHRPDNVYHYNSDGKLLRIEIDNNNPNIYPKKSVTYNSKGKLHAVVLYISPSEQYNFDGQGNLVVHWIGERGFNRSGQLLKIRRSL